MDEKVKLGELARAFSGSLDAEKREISPLNKVLIARAELNDRLYSAIEILESRLGLALYPEPESDIASSVECVDAGSVLVRDIHSENIKTQNAINKIYQITRRLEI